MDYAKLKVLLADPACPEGDQAAADWCNTPSVKRLKPEGFFVSYRSLLGNLSQSDYLTVKKAIRDLMTGPDASVAEYVSDIHKMLERPDADGKTGGVDFAIQKTQDFITWIASLGLISSQLAAALKDTGFETVSPAEAAGIERPEAAHVQSARAGLGE